jgi:hypothetical protein
MPATTELSKSSSGVDLLRQAVGQAQSAICAVAAELEHVNHVAPERLPALLMRARSLARIAREAIAIADDALFAVVGAAPPVPNLCAEDAAKGSGRHRRAETEPGEETDPGSW